MATNKSKKLSAKQIPSVEQLIESWLFQKVNVGALGIGERNTVSNGPDDGTLNKNAASLWNCLRHGNTSQMADNLTGNTSERACNVGGHGNTGFFETGAGQQGPWNTDQFIYSFNSPTWGPQLRRLTPRNYIMMTIWACHTGEGQDGADLVYLMSQIANFPVRATNGFVLTNGQGVWIEANAVWVTATPTSKPTPQPAPTPHSILIRKDLSTIVLHEKARAVSVPVEKVSRIDIERFSLTSGRINLHLTGQEAVGFAQRLLYTVPIDLPGAPSAFITARIRITFDGRNGQARRDFIIYNDRMAVDAYAKKAYYTYPGNLFID